MKVQISIMLENDDEQDNILNVKHAFGDHVLNSASGAVVLEVATNDTIVVGGSVDSDPSD